MKFQELRKINVNEHVEKKGNLSYLSWVWAVDQLLSLDETATWSYGEPKQYGDTLMVFCTVTAFGKSRTAQLPVMDYKNKAIANPDAFQVNTAMQRCLAKAISLHGIGLYIYAGEDLPEDAPKETKAGKANGNYRPAVNALNAKPYKMREGCEVTPDRMEYVTGVIANVLKWVEQKRWADAVLEFDNAKLEVEEKLFVWTFLDSTQRAAIKQEDEKQRQQYDLATQA